MQMSSNETRSVKWRYAASAAVAVALATTAALPTLAAPFAYVANRGSGDVSVIDTASNTVVGTIEVGVGPTGVAIDAEAARVYVLNSDERSVSVIDTATQTVTSTVPVCPRATLLPPMGVALSGDGAQAYVGCGFTAEINRIDTATFAVTPATIGQSYHFVQGMAVDVAAGRVYAQLRDDFGGGAHMLGIDAATLAIVSFTPMPTDFFTTLTMPLGLAASTSGLRVYVPHPISDVVRVFDASSGAVRTVALPSRSIAVVINQAATRAYAALRDDSVAVIDTVTETLITTIPVGSVPWGLSFNADESALYVTNAGDDSVSVIDTSDHTILTSIPVGDAPIAVGRFIARPPACGDGALNGDEECDAGDANGADASCCAADCTAARAGLSCADDANPCTSDRCDGAGSCVHAPQAGPCDDFVFCNGADSCANGTCSVHAGDPCILGSPCNNICNEIGDTCQSANGSSCSRGTGVQCDSIDRCQDGVCVDQGGGDSDGDLVCDLSDNCPLASNPAQADADGDDFGNVCDSCFDATGARRFLDDPNPTLMIWRTARVDNANQFDMTRLTADFRIPSDVPVGDLPLLRDGARIVFYYTLGDVISGVTLDAVLPGGELDVSGAARGWRLGSGGRRWIYRDRSTAPIGGIRSIVLSDRSHVAPGLVRLRVRGAGHIFESAELPDHVVITLGGAAAAASGLCGESAYDHPPDCAIDAAFRRWTCKRRLPR